MLGLLPGEQQLIELPSSDITVICDDNLLALKGLADERVDLCYTDPPFNTGKTQHIHGRSYGDNFEDYLGFLRPRLEEIYRVLKPTGSLLLHLDYREVHYVKVMLDEIFGRQCFVNEVIWAYDYGGRPKNKWPCKHDNILWYVKNPSNYTFNFDEIDRISYMAPSLVGAEKAARGKTPTDVHWQTIVPTQGKERVGYPTQKPRGLIDRFVKVHSNPGDMLLDPFAGSGTLGAAAANHGRNATLIDNNPEAANVMLLRLCSSEVI